MIAAGRGISPGDDISPYTQSLAHSCLTSAISSSLCGRQRCKQKTCWLMWSVVGTCSCITVSSSLKNSRRTYSISSQVGQRVVSETDTWSHPLPSLNITVNRALPLFTRHAPALLCGGPSIRQSSIVLGNGFFMLSSLPLLVRRFQIHATSLCKPVNCHDDLGCLLLHSLCHPHCVMRTMLL